ncbi:MAG: gliding motility-associated ABC transporter permease subunit GldF [Bacteroidales bacterium]|nr:MAG: gliding motility-associated ABC transporter permease subunit GldF [Bacteroidales bacterium]
MIALLRKEINGFFSTLTGYIVIIVFLIANSLFMWVFPGELNILDSGYATIDTLFVMAPWIFLFLVPAVTMKMFADENKAGTMEWLFTKPLTDMEIILAKFFAGLIVVMFSIIPCLVYYVTVYLLGNPVGNIDSGGTYGSFIGLFFLAGVYVAIGLFASALTNNQIVAFIIAVLICFLMYIGFDSVSTISLFRTIDHVIVTLGINDHYQSMSRGVIDSRDIVYYILLIALFVILTKVVIQSRKW